MIGATSAIKIALGYGKDIPKSDKRIEKVGITNHCELNVGVLQEPDLFKVTVNFSTTDSTFLDMKEV